MYDIEIGMVCVSVHWDLIVSPFSRFLVIPINHLRSLNLEFIQLHFEIFAIRHGICLLQWLRRIKLLDRWRDFVPDNIL